jgi:hypothetical protein
VYLDPDKSGVNSGQQALEKIQFEGTIAQKLEAISLGCNRGTAYIAKRGLLKGVGSASLLYRYFTFQQHGFEQSDGYASSGLLVPMA